MAAPYNGGRQIVRKAFIRKKAPLASVDILIASLSEASLRQYESGFKKWWDFYANEEIDPFSCSTNNVLLFLTREFEKGASYLQFAELLRISGFFNSRAGIRKRRKSSTLISRYNKIKTGSSEIRLDLGP
ncbi:hypothetical protein KPH14_008884 [Odynerus spinipes]|uniref:Uncharacterized protein n=1 Tax=Odynerus spinipes TaxID=1348599 RepID=A0AAD9VM25_9HYME|nr:hypothetical protein KPH14_008884 [Odynerus spinipes]